MCFVRIRGTVPPRSAVGLYVRPWAILVHPQALNHSSASITYSSCLFAPGPTFVHAPGGEPRWSENTRKRAHGKHGHVDRKIVSGRSLNDLLRLSDDEGKGRSRQSVPGRRYIWVRGCL